MSDITYEFRPRPRKDPLEVCYDAGWRNPEDLGFVLSGFEEEPEFTDLRSPARARARIRSGEIGSYVANIGVVVDAEQVSTDPCKCSPVMSNWMFLPRINTASLTRIEPES